MADIKSALEIAMEKIAQMGEATEEERLKWKHTPEGEKLATRYLKEDCNLVAELSQHPENIRKYIAEGAAGILIRNIDLPRHDAAKKSNRKAMDGLKILKSDKVGVENIYSRIRYLFNHYTETGAQQRQQAYQSLKTELEAKVQQTIQQQLGSLKINIDVEKQPEFQQEWRRIQNQLDSQYLTLLSEYQRELSAIS
ncbi:MAG: hypothetical protein HY528_00015 [Chloroflexi bacterium]|nr:hypothetical protein [Chloroflexota bacterium]